MGAPMLAVRNQAGAYVLENGRTVKGGPAEQLRNDSDIREFYLGVGESGRRSFCVQKAYRRRRAW